MPTTRIVPLEAPFESPVAQVFQKYLPPGMAPLKLFRTQAHNPRVLQRVFACSLLDPGAIDARTRELVILRTCFRCGSEYEWGVHVALFAQQGAITAADMAATQSQPGPGLQEHEALLFDAVDELHETSTISDSLWSALEKHYSPAQLLEVIALVGYYHMISFMTNAARVEPEDFAPRFGAPLWGDLPMA